ncbi:MAG: Por secretion system protein [Bacteroidaceae bacterium]|nr:Por secretion system protein [Bacteroidaceae bacterium]
MKKRILLLVSVLFLQGYMLALWASPGTWRSHLAYHNATHCVALNGKVYVVSNGSLYSYTNKDGLVECYDKANILSDRTISHIAACEKTKTLVVIYDNANIDLIRPNGDVVNITDYLNESSLDPKVNGLCVINGKAYLATNFGATVLDVARGEFGDTYKFDIITYSCVELGGFIYAATKEGLYCGDKFENLLDVSNWELLSTEVYAQLATLGNDDKQLMALKSNGSIYSIASTDGTPTLFREGTFNFAHNVGEKFLVGNKSYAYVYSSPANYNHLTFDGTANNLTTDGSVYWTCNGAKGLNGYQYDKSSERFVKTIKEIIPNSPIRNYCQYLNVVDGRLLVAGGCLNFLDKTFYNGTLMMYENGEWSSFEEDGIAAKTAGRYRNITSIVQDPKDANHHYASSFGQGIYEFQKMKFVRQYTHKEKGGLESVVVSPLESAVPTSYEYTRISRLQYDKQGNLWITNADGGFNVTCPLKIMKPDGEFVGLYYEELAKLPTVTEVLLASNGLVWVVSMREPAQLFCIDMNGTLEDTRDDRVKRFNEYFVDQDAGSVLIYFINDIAEDLNGDIWVMTNKGPYVLYNTEKAFEDNYHFTKIKVPRNDGTNYADYLLDGAYTTCVEVDAANRKWIGTLNSGLYLVGDDGIETVHHFTAENSPLPSNSIESLALDHSTGELYIGTDKGLVSYTSDATQGVGTYNDDEVYAYPNPIVSCYDGLITVVGLKANSHVKVINTAGRLVAEGTSLGGTFTWDGRTPQGQRVSTGVYYVLACDEDGNEGVATKVLFIK